MNSFQDFSYGVIPLKKIDLQWSILLVHQNAKYWSFPKGHKEVNETPLQAAKRELQEETGLVVTKLLVDEPIVERYSFFNHGTPIDKTVFYFIALVTGVLKVQEDEILEAKWVSLEEACDLVTFSQGKLLCKQIIDILSEIK